MAFAAPADHLNVCAPIGTQLGAVDVWISYPTVRPVHQEDFP